MATKSRPADHAERRHLVAAIFALTLLTVLAYGRTLDVPWYFDDVPNIVENPLIRDVENFFDPAAAQSAGGSPAQLYGLRTRWVAFLTFALDFRRAGYSPAAFHATNLAVHVLAAIAVLFFLRRLFAGRLELALFGAFVFALHPLQTGAVTYVVQRMASLAGLLCLAAVLLYLTARDGLAAGGGMRRPRFFVPYPAALACGAAACFVKQNAIVLPALVGLVECLHPAPDAQSSWRRRILRVVPFAIVPLWISLPVARVLVSSPGGSIVPPAETHVVGETVSSLANLATQGEVMWRYLRRLALPYGQVFDLGLAVDRNPWRLSAMAAGLGLVVLLAAALALRRHAPVVTLGTLWFFTALAVESSVYALDPYFEHRLYLPMAGVTMVAADGLGRWTSAGWRRRAVVALPIVVALALLTVRRNEQWRDPAELWRADLGAGSKSYRSAIGLADTLHRRGETERAEDIYRGFVRDALLRCFDESCGAKYLLNAGVAAERIRESQQALVLYRRALERFPDYATAHYNLGVLLYQEGREREALAAFERASELAPGDADVLFNRAMVALELGDPQPARAVLPILSGLRPDLVDELTNELDRRSRPGGE